MFTINPIEREWSHQKPCHRTMPSEIFVNQAGMTFKFRVPTVKFFPYWWNKMANSGWSELPEKNCSIYSVLQCVAKKLSFQPYNVRHQTSSLVPSYECRFMPNPNIIDSQIYQDITGVKCPKYRKLEKCSLHL